MTTKHEGHPLYAGSDAHPTAPGGMSQQALTRELIDKHGWTERLASFPLGLWAEQIEAVVKERRNRELEAEALRGELTKRLAEGLDIPVELLTPAIEVDSTPEPKRKKDKKMKKDKKVKAKKGTPVVEPVVAEPLFLPEIGTRDFMFAGHHGTGPSGAHRWAECTEALGMTRAFLETLSPEQQEVHAISGDPARQGTTAHKAAEAEAQYLLGRLMKKGRDKILKSLKADDGTGYDDEMRDHLTEYIDLIDLLHREGHEILIESKVSAVVPLTGSHDGEVREVTGSLDMAGLPIAGAEERVLVVGDLKYGNGIYVEAEKNPQLRSYGLGLLSELVDGDGKLPHIDRIDYYVIQPRMGGTRKWSETVESLLAWRDDELAPALTAALFGEGAQFVPGDACDWCPAVGFCGARTEHIMGKATEMFGELTSSELAGEEPDALAARLTDEQLGRMYVQSTGVIKLQEELKAEAHRRAVRGHTIPGAKLVSYSPARVWVAGSGSHFEANAELWQRKMISPTQALKIADADGWSDEAKADLVEMIYSPEKKPVIALADDKRKEWTGLKVDDMFTEVKD